jgi:hypothetical protein
MWGPDVFIRSWPVDCVVPYPRNLEYQDDCYHNREVTLYFMKAPHWDRECSLYYMNSDRCDLCFHRIAAGDPITADLYHRDKYTLIICEHCSRHHGPLRRECEMRGEFDYDTTAATLDLGRCSANIVDPSGVYEVSFKVLIFALSYFWSLFSGYSEPIQTVGSPTLMHYPTESLLHL